MKTKISLWYGSIRADRVIELSSGEIFRVNLINGTLKHETWFDRLDDQRREQVKSQVPVATA